MICLALSKSDEILQEESILSAVNTITCRGMKSWSAFLTITIVKAKLKFAEIGELFFTKYIL